MSSNVWEIRVRRLLAGALTAAALGFSAFLVASSAVAPTVTAGAHSTAPSAAVVKEAHAAFKKFLAEHISTRLPARVSPGEKALGAGSHKGNVTALADLNWSGYADTSATTTADDFTNVTGSWTIPAVQCPTSPYQNSGAYNVNWVGIDGFSDSTVEQLGSGAQCFEGVLYYYVWYEMYPGATAEEGTLACIENNVNCPQPGDQVTASVTVTPGTSGNNNYTLTLIDHTRPQESFTDVQTCPVTTCVDSSAEWIIERPAYAPAGLVQFVPLADFGQSSFTSGSLVANGRRSTVNGFNGAVYDMSIVDDSGSYYLDCPFQQAPVGVLPFTTANSDNCPAEPPTPRGGFSVTWDTSF